MRYLLAALMLMASAPFFCQDDCDLFNIQDLAADYLSFGVDTVILQPDGSYEVQLSNGTTASINFGCTDIGYFEYDASSNVDDGSCATLASSCSEVEMDGYSYSVVEIGDQCWFAENLRTTEYGNGDVIPAGLTDSEWGSTASGATAVYGEGSSSCYDYSPDNDACDEAQSLEEYGRLYNWYAVDDARGLCPTGWHVPTDGEWTDLEDYITAQGFSGSEGTALKSTYGWYNGGNGTDDFGFSALPGGSRNFGNGNFDFAGSFGSWWSSSPPSGGDAWSRDLASIYPAILHTNANLRYGFSVRCLRDAD